MNTHTTKTKENKTPIANQELIQKQNDVSPFQFMDNRPKAVTQRKIQELADNRNQVAQLKGLNKIIPNTAMNVTQLQSMEVIILHHQEQGLNWLKLVLNTIIHRLVMLFTLIYLSNQMLSMSRLKNVKSF